MSRGRGNGGKEHVFCCCAIPLLNTGIYLSLLEQLAAGILIGTLLLAAPPIVGVSIPSFTPWILAGLLYLTSLCQILGFFGVSRESTKQFRTYNWINTSLVIACFALAGTLIGISASRHNTVVAACEASFFPAAANTTSTVGASVTDGESSSMCNIFAWVDIGVLGGLWLLLAIFQGYLLLINSFYSRDQLADHKRYYSIYSTQDDILLDDRAPGGNPWDTRASLDMNDSRDMLAEPAGAPGPSYAGQYRGGGEAEGGGDGGVAGVGSGTGAGAYNYTHARTASEASEASTIRGEPFVPPNSPPRGGFGHGYGADGDEQFVPPGGEAPAYAYGAQPYQAQGEGR